MPGRFIVVFKDTTTDTQIEEYIERLKSEGGEIHNRYDTLFKGFAATMPDNLIQSLQGDRMVDWMEPDGYVTTQ